MLHEAIWRNPKYKKVKKGQWKWNWNGGYFMIYIGNNPGFRCYNETPDWGEWVREDFIPLSDADEGGGGK
jgi:hypothetical protein